MRILRHASTWLLAGLIAATIACGTDRPSQPAAEQDRWDTSGFATDSGASTPTSTPPFQETTGATVPVLVPVTVTPIPTATAAPPPAASPTTADPSSMVPPTSTPPGTVLVAIPFIRDKSGLNSTQAEPFLPFLGFGETLFRRNMDDEPQPWLATGFEVAPDLSGATITIREGVPFHRINGDFGDLTAEDVAWSMNNANRATNPASTHASGALFEHLWGEWVANDPTTVRFVFTNHDGKWAEEFVNQAGAMFTVFSKQAFEENGAAWAQDNVVATGPFEVEEWESGSHLVLVNRYADGGSHYLPELTPDADRVRFAQVPEAATRVALMRVGEADAAVIRPEEAEWMVGGGFKLTSTASGEDQLVFNPDKIVGWEMGRTGESFVGDTWDLLLQERQEQSQHDPATATTPLPVTARY